jgi:uncharacterized membrane protein YhhN
VGQSPSFGNHSGSIDFLPFLGDLVMQMPAWLVVGFTGFLLAHVCRQRRARRRFARTIG